MRGQRIHLLEYLFQREVVHPGKIDSVLEGLEFAPAFPDPKLFKRRRPKHDDHIRGVRLHLQDVLDNAGEIDALRHQCRVGFQKLGRDQPGVHAHVYDRSAGEE